MWSGRLCCRIFFCPGRTRRNARLSTDGVQRGSLSRQDRQPVAIDAAQSAAVAGSVPADAALDGGGMIRASGAGCAGEAAAEAANKHGIRREVVRHTKVKTRLCEAAVPLGGRAQLRLGHTTQKTRPRLRAPFQHARRLPRLRLRLTHARRPVQNTQHKFITGFREGLHKCSRFPRRLKPHWKCAASARLNSRAFKPLTDSETP